MTSTDDASTEVESKIKEFLIDFLKESLKIAESNQNKLKISDEIFPELKNGCYYRNTTRKNKNYEYFVDRILIDEIKNISPYEEMLADTYCCCPNLAGLPHISIPSGKDNNMPTGMMIISNHFTEDKLLWLSNKIK